MNYSVCITTFSLRFHFVETLISQIRGYTNSDILLAINGNYMSDFDEEYRKKILLLCQKYEGIFPIFFPEQRGLSKLWNTLVVHSKTDWNLILNDDVEITLGEVFESVLSNLGNDPQIFRINGSLSHFIIHKKLLHDLGYFDERFLGFGSEDSDFCWRHVKKYNTHIPEINVHGFVNFVSNIKDEKITTSMGSKYTMFNQNFLHGIQTSKYFSVSEGIAGWFSFPVDKKLEDITQYPYESFFWENKKFL
jgi:hypothetical protein